MRFKIVACILLILSVFNFALAAPVPAREVREARADAVEDGENVIIVSGKRAIAGNPYEGEESDSDSGYWSFSPGRLAAIEASSGSHSGSGTPLSSQGGNKSPMLISGRTELSLDPEGAFKPGTTTENQPASSSTTKSVSWGTENKVVLPSGQIASEPLPPVVKDLPLPPGREGYLAKMAAQSSPPPKPQSKSFVSKFMTYFGKIGTMFQQTVSHFKTVFGKLGKLGFRPRFQREVDT